MDSRIPSHWPPVSTSWTKHSVKTAPGTSLVVQWLRLHAPNAGGPGSTPCWKTRSHTLQPRVHMMPLKIPPGGRWKISRVATKTWYSPKTTTTTSTALSLFLHVCYSSGRQMIHPSSLIHSFGTPRPWSPFSAHRGSGNCFPC